MQIDSNTKPAWARRGNRGLPGMTTNLRGDSYGALPIDRDTEWGNPYAIGREGSRQTVIEKYRDDLWEAVRTGSLTLEKLAGLAGKRLACWCSPLKCHGDVLAAAAAWAAGELGRRRETGESTQNA